MIVAKHIEQVRSARWAEPSLSWALVPTMGYLHQGHLALLARARVENDRVAASVFVNPSQFAPTEDFEAYPRDLDRDLTLLEESGADLIFVPDETTMYPPGFQTRVVIEHVTRLLEGASRPTHFDGVATVVAKLFNIVQPSRAYFGQKDAQQTIVIQRLVHDMNYDLEVVICPTVREPDGLAMSSRNARLSADERKAAAVLFRALSKAKQALQEGEKDGDVLRRMMGIEVELEPLAQMDYVSAADPNTLEEVERVKDRVLLSLAVFIGPVRLIDNMLVAPSENQ